MVGLDPTNAGQWGTAKKTRNFNAPQIARVGRVKPDHDDEKVTTAIMRTADGAIQGNRI